MAWIILATGNDGQYQRLCGILGLEDIATAPEFLTNADRIAHREEMTARIMAATALAEGRSSGRLRGQGGARRADQ